VTDAGTRDAPPPGAPADGAGGADAADDGAGDGADDAPGGRRRKGRAESREARQQRHAEERDARRRRREPWLRAGRALIRWMPLPVACVAGECVGLLLYLGSGWLRRQTLANLERAFGATKTAAERRAIARRCYGLVGRGLFAYIVLHRMGRERTLTYIDEAPRPDEIRAAMQGGSIVLSQHFGAFEVLAAWLAKEFGVRAVGRDAKDGDATSMLIAMRRDMGANTVEQGNPREMLRVLKSGGCIGMLIDQDIRHVNGIFVPFFGHPAHTPIGPATFAVRMKVPLVYTTIEWTSLTRHRVTVGPLLHARTDLPHDEAVAELTARAVKAGEEIIRANPAHWIWMHERWRTKPGDVAGDAAGDAA
jgi:KDO2-lipid IV(A) lauroyltransferase